MGEEDVDLGSGATMGMAALCGRWKNAIGRAASRSKAL